MNPRCPSCGGEVLSLRDWFAGQALAALIAHIGHDAPTAHAEEAYVYADAMIAAREATAEKKP